MHFLLAFQDQLVFDFAELTEHFDEQWLTGLQELCLVSVGGVEFAEAVVSLAFAEVQCLSKKPRFFLFMK